MMKNIRYKSIVVRSEANNPTMRAKTKLEKKAGNKETKQVCTCVHMCAHVTPCYS
jgi:hypothetical protein